jgi:DNA-binding transcriptional ArsR family regulator
MSGAGETKGQHAWKEHRWQDQQDFVTAINHPLRVRLLTILTVREASPSEVAKELGAELGVVNYHARKLEDLGMVEVVRERPVRGSTEHFYKATTRPWWTTEQWTKVNPKVKAAATACGLRWLFDDAAAALNAGTFDSRNDRHLSRVPIALDERGWQAVSALLDDTLDTLLEEQARASERMVTSGEKPIPAVVGMLSFEMPPRASAAGSSD